MEQEDRKRKSAPDAELPKDCDQVREGEEEADADADAQKKKMRTTIDAEQEEVETMAEAETTDMQADDNIDA